MFEQVELENLARAGYMLVMKDKEAPTPPKVRQLISRMYREMRAGIAKRDRSGGGPQGDAQSGGRRGWNGSLWRVSGRGGRGGHALTRHRRHQGGGLVDGDYIGGCLQQLNSHRKFHDGGGRSCERSRQGVRFDVTWSGWGVAAVWGPDLVEHWCVCPPCDATRPLCVAVQISCGSAGRAGGRCALARAVCGLFRCGR